MTDILTAVGAFLGGFVGALAYVLKFVIPRRIENQVESKVAELRTNELQHIKEKLESLSGLPEQVARLDERTKDAQKDIEALWKRLNGHINGTTK